LGSEKVEYWGNVVAEPATINAWSFWFALIIAFALLVFLFLVSLISIFIFITALVIFGAIALNLEFPLITTILSVQPDIKVYENGVALFYRLRDPRFHAWEKFEGFRWEDEVKGRPKKNSNIVLVPKKLKWRDRAPFVRFGKDMDDPRPAWDHVKGRLDKLGKP
jgi:hypothetical protein